LVQQLVSSGKSEASTVDHEVYVHVHVGATQFKCCWTNFSSLNSICLFTILLWKAQKSPITTEW